MAGRRARGPVRDDAWVPGGCRRRLHALGAGSARQRCRRTAVARCARGALHGTAGRLVRDAGPRDRPVCGFLRRAARLRAAAGYQAQAVQQDAARYPGAPSGEAGPRDGAGTVASGYAAGTAAGQAGYQAAPTAYGYDQAGYSGNGHTEGYGDSERGGAGTFTAGYAATGASGAGAYPEGQGANGYAANGHGSNGYGTNEYQTNGYAANGSGAGDYPAGEPGGRGPAPSGAYQRLPANGYAAGYANGTAPGNGSANGTAAPANVVPTFTPSFTANGAASPSVEAGGNGRPGQPAATGYTPMPGYGASPSGGPQAYQATPAYANGNGAGYPANGNGYSPASPNGNGYQTPNGAPQANGYQAPNGAPQANGYQAPNGAPQANGYQAPNSGPQPNGYQAPNGAPQPNGYQHDGYASGQPAGHQATDYPPAPGYAQVGQADQAQQGYWDQEQQPRGNWT